MKNNNTIKYHPHLGTSWRARAKKWRAKFRHKYLGLFDLREEAHQAYLNAAAEAKVTIIYEHTTVHDVFHYDPETGFITYRLSGERAEHISYYGYLEVTDPIRCEKVRAQRLIWELYHKEAPPADMFVDHANRERQDNRINNLRLLTPAQSSWNTGVAKNSKSGIKGVTWNTRDGLWQGEVKRGKRARKCFKLKSDAIAFVKQKRKELHGEFACHG